VRIAIGPRSALFVPLKNIGLIVVDEEHDSSYKQTDGQPRYNARDVALYWAKMNDALVILGSATPSLESFYNALSNKHTLLTIPERVKKISLPEVHVVDMRGRKERMFSELLLEKITDCLERKEQVILLQNRRGYSSFLQCIRCGFIALCPNCELSLTYHSSNETVQCHFCGYSETPADYCPACGGEQIRYSGAGTQKIEFELNRLFPKTKVIRMDLDTTRGKNRYDRMLQSFGNQEADILLGTQMVAKGLDFPNVTLVGVISADIGLSLPDFRSSERVFQLLMQVAGRSGRSSKKGDVVIQSSNLTHYAIQLARKHDYKSFYTQEIKYRQNRNYPPFNRLIKILISTKSLHEAISYSRVFGAQIKRIGGLDNMIIGPAPDIFPKLNNLFRWQINLKLPIVDQKQISRIKKQIVAIVEPYLTNKQAQVQIAIDVDPISI
jgi:primosomal protein N' (replication factor Y)